MEAQAALKHGIAEELVGLGVGGLVEIYAQRSVQVAKEVLFHFVAKRAIFRGLVICKVGHIGLDCHQEVVVVVVTEACHGVVQYERCCCFLDKDCLVLVHSPSNV